jgi:protein-disulfide isomerase
MSKKKPSSSSNRAADRAARAAAALAEQQRQERRRRTRMIGLVVAGLVVIVVAGWLISRSLDTTTDVNADAASSSSEFGLAIGPDDAPNKVVIYEDFLCPYCGELESASHEDMAKLAEEGKVYVEYRPFNLLRSDYSVAAASAFKVVLDASGPEVAKKFHDLLYAEQPDEGGPYPDSDWLVQKAVQAGASESAVREGIENETAKSWVDDATAKALDAGVRSTPTVLLNGDVFQSGRTIDQFAENLLDEVR